MAPTTGWVSNKRSPEAETVKCSIAAAKSIAAANSASKTKLCAEDN